MSIQDIKERLIGFSSFLKWGGAVVCRAPFELAASAIKKVGGLLRCMNYDNTVTENTADKYAKNTSNKKWCKTLEEFNKTGDVMILGLTKKQLKDCGFEVWKRNGGEWGVRRFAEDDYFRKAEADRNAIDKFIELQA